MGKAVGWLVALIIVIIIVAAGVAIFHKSPAKSNNSSSTTSSPNSSSNNSAENEVNNAVVTTRTNSSLGKYLADPNDNTLYTIGNSPANCEGSCISSWPAYQDKGATTGLPTNIGTLKRPDNGQIQYTYKGLPLYYFVSDSEGQVTGNGVSGFSVARP